MYSNNKLIYLIKVEITCKCNSDETDFKLHAIFSDRGSILYQSSLRKNKSKFKKKEKCKNKQFLIFK